MGHGTCSHEIVNNRQNITQFYFNAVRVCACVLARARVRTYVRACVRVCVYACVAKQIIMISIFSPVSLGLNCNDWSLGGSSFKTFKFVA